MNIELRRIRYRPETIDGQIWIDGEKVCDCAENAHHCLPQGIYQIEVSKCSKHVRKMPIVLPKPDCDKCARLQFVCNNTSMPCKCVQLCPGNGVYNRTDGAIIVGKYICPGCLSHPKSAFDALYERIRKNIERGNPVNIIITSI